MDVVRSHDFDLVVTRRPSQGRENGFNLSTSFGLSKMGGGSAPLPSGADPDSLAKTRATHPRLRASKAQRSSLAIFHELPDPFSSRISLYVLPRNVPHSMSAPKSEEAIFAEALWLPPEQRRAYLDQACGPEGPVRERIEALLKAYQRAGAFLEEPAAPAARASKEASTLPTEKLGDSIGRYKLLHQIGEGGCGVVYMAEQGEPVRRLVALKVIKLGMDTKQVIAQFEAERQALALMDQPHIAKVLDGGATGAGRPYFVMELVRGIPITRYCDENQLDTTRRLELFILVCQAIQHAHQKGIIHRDIKPSNVLVVDHDGTPVPKVIDFGIAKATAGQRLTDKTLFTAFEQFIGTPAYMSPEQAKLSGVDIDTRSDIYSLGVLLYELLTGKTPFDAKRLVEGGLDEIRRIIREEDPPRPSTRLSALHVAEQTAVARQRQTEPPKLVGLVRGDLDWIVMKTLEKDRSRRYQTANGLAMDIQRYLGNEPVLARPPSSLYRLQKLAHRNRLAFLAVGAITVSLILGLGLATWMFVKERTARRAADLALYRSRLSETRSLRMARPQGWSDFAFRNLSNNAAMHVSELDTVELRSEAVACMQDPDIHEVGRFLGGHVESVWSLDFARDGAVLASADYNGVSKLWQVDTGKSLFELKDPHAGVVERYSPSAPYPAIRFDPRGKLVAYSTWDNAVELVSRKNPAEPRIRISSTSQAQYIAFDRAGAVMAVGWADERVVVYKTSDWEILREISLKGQGRIGRQCVALSPNGAELALLGANNGIKIYHLRENAPPVHLGNHEGAVSSLCFDAEGERLVSTSEDRTAKVFDVARGVELFTLQGHKARVKCAAFRPGGRMLVTVSDDQTARLWDARTGQVLLVVRPGIGPLLSVAFSADGQEIAMAYQTVVIYRLTNQGAMEGLFGHKYFINGLAFHPSEPILASSSADNSIILWDLRTGSPQQSLPGHPRGYPYQIEFSHDGQLLAAGHYAFGNYQPSNHMIRLWETRTGRLSGTLDGHANLAPRLAFAPSGALLASGDVDGVTILWDVPTGEEIRRWSEHSDRVESVSFLKEGSTLMIAYASGRLQLRDYGTGTLKVQVETHFTPGNISVSRTMAAVTSVETGEIRLFALPCLDRLRTLSHYHGAGLTRATFSPDGHLLVSAGHDGLAIFWSALDGKMLVKLPLQDSPLGPVAFDSTGSHLALGDQAEQISVWDLHVVRQNLRDIGLDWEDPARQTHKIESGGRP
jgi:WD40 repeat protein/serine/threonine protein kinase